MKFWHSRNNPKIKLLPKEMLEISQEISRDFAPSAKINVPELVLLPVDPYHLYAYWNLGEFKGEQVEKVNGEAQLILRVYWRPDDSIKIANTKLWFDVAIQSSQNQCKVLLPVDETHYSAAIGRRNPDHRFNAFAHSNLIHVPRGRMAPDPHTGDFTECKAKPQVVRPSREISRSAPKVDHAYDEALIDSRIKKTLSPTSLEKNIVIPVKNEDDGSDANDTSDEALIDCNIQKTLYEKGIDTLGDILSGSEKASSEKSYYTSKTASGQGSNT
ncbi:MAG: DUF4912 domain-containing protein [Pseudomonadota bacterium]